MASWIRESPRTRLGNFDEEEQIESPAMPHSKYAGMSDDDILDLVCLDYVLRGGKTKYLAKYLNVSVRTVERNIERAKLHKQSRSPYEDPECEILFPVVNFTPESPCVHPVPIPEGKREYCPSCHKTGVEGHPAFRVRPGDTESPKVQPPRDESLHGGTDSPKKSPRKPKVKVGRKAKRAATAV